MIQVIGVRFRNAGKIYYFDPGEEQIARGISVIVETSRGTEMGMVILPNTEMEDDQVVQPLKPIIRIAGPDDFAVVKEHKQKEKDAYKICQEKIREHNLEMKLVDVEYTFDSSKLMFYFTADGRVDFRELVKDLASIFKMRIELRQIGVRDETKILGGVGICGRTLCCHSYLSDFIPVSIKMAKEQNLSLNPTKISGVCGRLMCCLKNEEDTYEYLNKQLPRIGEMATVTAEGEEGEVQSVNVLRQRVKLLIKQGDDSELKEYPVTELDFGPDRKKPEPKPEVPVFLQEKGPEPQSREKEQFARSSRRGNRQNGSQREKEEEGSSRRQEFAGRPGGGRGDRRAERTEKAESSERPERSERKERAERTDRQERRERSERPSRGEHKERREHRERRDPRENRAEGQKPEVKEHAEHGEHRAEGQRPEARERADHREHRAEGQRPEIKGRAEHGERRPEGQKSEARERSEQRENRPEGRERPGRRSRDFRRNRGQDKNRQAAEKNTQ